AGGSFLTLGVSDAKVWGGARVVVIMAGLTGLAIVTVVATFLLSVQQALTRREVLVLSTLTTAGHPPSGLAILETYGLNGSTSALSELFHDWERAEPAPRDGSGLAGPRGGTSPL